MEAYNETRQPFSFEQQVRASLLAKPVAERAVLERFLDPPADDFDDWSFLFAPEAAEPVQVRHHDPMAETIGRIAAPKNRFERVKRVASSMSFLFSPVLETTGTASLESTAAEETNSGTATPEAWSRRITSAAKAVGLLAMGAVDWVKEHTPERRVSPKTRKNLGRVATAAVAVTLLGSAAHNVLSNNNTITLKPADPSAHIKQPVEPVSEQGSIFQVPKPELSPAAEALNPGVSLFEIYQQQMANNTKAEQQKAEEKAAGEAAAKVQAAAEQAAKEKAAAMARVQQTSTSSGAYDCEQYRPLVAQYDWPVEAAMLTMKVESGCNPDAISATDDHGLFQLNGRRIYDPSINIKIAHALWADGRVGENNFSAWYAVCTPGDNPQPKYAGINCQ